MKIKKGDIFVEHWGYDQTNADYYKVLKATAKTVILRQLATKTTPDKEPGAMTGTNVPIKNKWERDSKPFRRTVYLYMGRPHVRIRSYSSAELWDGTPQNISWYA